MGMWVLSRPSAVVNGESGSETTISWWSALCFSGAPISALLTAGEASMDPLPSCSNAGGKDGHFLTAATYANSLGKLLGGFSFRWRQRGSPCAGALCGTQ